MIQEVQILRGYSNRVDESSSESNPKFPDESTRYEVSQFYCAVTSTHIGMENDVAQLRKRLHETEMKHARMIHDVGSQMIDQT